MKHVGFNRRWFPALLVLAAACADGQNPVAPNATLPDIPARRSIQSMDCVASVRSGTVSCGVPAASGGNRAIYGSQSSYVKLTSSNVSTSPGFFQFDVTVQNLLREQVGTPDGVRVDTGGIKVFFESGPTVTSGSGNISVDNEDGEKIFTGATPQPFFRYAQKLATNEVTPAKTWRLAMDSTVQGFTFGLYIEAEVQPLLVINEVLVNPGGTITDANGEWFEVYNAGTFPVQMQGMLIADSAASGRRPYHTIASSLNVQPGGYVVLGNSTNTTLNGGAPVNYAYSSALQLANSLDAVAIARPYAGDTLSIDRAAYTVGGSSYQNGVSRELKNPSLDNSNMDGVNWGDAMSVFGAAGRGTPGAQNSVFVP